MYLQTALYQKNDQKPKLFWYLLTRMPKNCLYSISKTELRYKYTTSNYAAIKKAKFLTYNKKAFSELIFDIDNITHTNLFKNLDNLAQTFYNKFQIPINWACATNSGVQFCITLNIPIKLTKKQKQVIADFKQFVIDNWALVDPNGSKRLKGWWRNPFTHRHKFYNNYITFNDILDFVKSNCISKQKQFKSHINKQKIAQQAKTTAKNYFEVGEFVKGNRNYFIFYNTMLSTNSTNFNTILNVCKSLNKQNALEQEELEHIAKSVLKYNTEGKNYIYLNSKKAGWRIGKMGLKKIKNLTEEDYKKEVKRRQSMGGKMVGTNNLKKHIINKQTQTQKKILKAIQQLQKENKKITGTAVAKVAEINIKTALKYLKELKQSNLI